MRKLLILLLMAAIGHLHANAQSLNTAASSISKAEYFFDKDPGVGKGTNLPVTSVTADSASITASISINGLSLGFHRLFVRTQDSNGKWSLFEGRTFNIFNPASTAVVSVPTAEYFFDKDPGVGKGIALNGSVVADSLTINSNISTTSLSKGFHILYVRAKDSKGAWSLFDGRTVYIHAPADTSKISLVTAEYFFDKDPGVGKGTALTGLTVQGDSLAINTSVATTGLKTGFHQLCVRVKDSKGLWGLFEKRTVYVNSLPTTYVPVSSAEYFFDKDPGVGKGTPITVTVTADSASFSGSINTTGLKRGFHHLFIRTAASNEWGLYEGRAIYIDSAAVQPKIVAVEYFFDNANPLPGKGTPIQIAAPGDSVSIQTALSASGLATGKHTVSVRAEDNTGKWGLLETRDITVTTCAQPLIAPFTASSLSLTTTSPTSSVADTAICASATLTLTAPAGYSSYNWINNATKQSVGTGASVTVPPGDYSVILPATTNCPADTIAINVSGAPSITVHPGPTGSGDTLISSSPNSNQWYFNGVVIPGATSQTYIAETSGSYTVVVANYCYPDPGVSSSPVSITVSKGATICTPPVIFPFTASASALDTTLCTGATINLSAPAGFASYNWINTTNNVDTTIGRGLLVSVAAGTYALILPATTTCQAETISVAVSGIPTITVKPGLASSSDTLVSSSATGNQWYLNGTIIPGATDQKYVAVVSGNYYVVVKSACYPAAGGVSSAVIPVTVSGVTSVTNAVSSLVSVYPNPTSDYVIISPSATNGGSYTGKLIDSKGQVMTTIQFSADYVLPVGYLASGLYLLEIQNNNSLQQTKIVVQQ